MRGRPPAGGLRDLISSSAVPRYRFAGFVLSPRERSLVRDGQAVPLIPRYFDLLLFLVERRREAVHRRDIFDRVWTDVIVSDSALSQAIRTLRRTLGDDPRTPQFIRTVSRHGYQFVCASLVEEDEDALAEPERPPSVAASPALPHGDRDPFPPLLAALAVAPTTPAAREEQRDAAERLHALGTADALRRLDGHPREAYARALLRDTRHQVPGAGEVPLLAAHEGMRAAAQLVRLRGRRGARLVLRRWLGGTTGAATAGLVAGLLGGLLLTVAPGSTAPFSVVPVLAAIGAACGALGGAGVSAGLSAAEVMALSARRAVLVPAAAAGGALAGGAAQLLARWTLDAVFGLAVPVGGLIEGLVIGTGVGAAFALATRTVRAGLAAPRGAARVRASVITAAGGAVAALLLALLGFPLVGGTIHLLAQASHGSQVLLTPLGRLVGEPEFGPLARALLSIGEGGAFGAGIAYGLVRRG